MNFAPYQDENPDNSRSPYPTPKNNHLGASKYTDDDDSSHPDRLPSPADFENNAGVRRGGFGNGLGADERNIDTYSTSLPMRIEIEACLAYILLPPAGGAMLLLFEHRNDYVRFHAWQSSLLFTALFLFHIIFSFTKYVSFLLLAIDLTLIAFLSLHAYKDSENLTRFELPWFGRIASNFVDAE